MKKLLYLLLFFSLVLPVTASAATNDLGLEPLQFELSKDYGNLIIGNNVRVYTYVVNRGADDATGYVVFKVDQEIVGQSEVSVTTNGVKDEVFADFTVPSYDFNIYVELLNVEPGDSNPDNNQILSKLYHVQGDNDNDGKGDDIDPDDDNDTWNDVYEESQGTDKFKKDTDGDGVIDPEDEFPLDASKYRTEPEPEPEPEVAPVIPTQQEKAPEVVPEPEKKSFIKELFTNDEDDERKAELVEQFYNSPDVELLKDVKINAYPVNWNTYDFSFTTNIDSLELESLDYVWTFSDGVESKEMGHHRFSGTGEYFVTLKVKGPWDNYIYDSVTINIEFWSVYNYWLWLIVLLIIAILFLYSYEFKHRHQKIADSNDVKAPKETKQRVPRSPKKPKIKKEE